MNRLACLCAVTLLVSACAGGDDVPPGDDTATDEIPEMITQDTVWSGQLKLVTFTSIAPGVTVTVMPGTTIDVTTSAASLDVAGTLDVQGEKAAPVTIASGPGLHWIGVSVSGTYTMHYGRQIGGGIFTTGADAIATIIDSELSHAIGDYVIMNDGTIDIEHTNLGDAVDDSSHCNLHINASRSVTFTHNNNAGSHYGLMFYAGTGDFTHNNWFANSEVDVEFGGGAVGAFDDSYFASGVPTGSGDSTFANMATAQLADCGPR